MTDPTTGDGATTIARDPSLAEQVAWACRILASQGYQDLTLGHVSVLTPDGVMYIKRKGVALSEVTPDDVLVFPVHADLADAPRDMHLEAVLHTEVYKRRPDVRCVIHGHPLYATAFGATDARLETLTHDAVLFTDRIATYEGVPDLITGDAQGKEVADALGDGTVILLRNHGVLVAERDTPWAVLTAVLLEKAAQLQFVASAYGALRPIPAGLVESIHARKYQSGFPDEYWDAWIRALRRGGLDEGMPS
ncbi:MAG TPA: class II aldolase/adducin family protein [Thermoleophilaceae bacterium]